MRAQTKKLTTAAVCTALAVIMCAMTAYLPLSIMPLYLAAFCIFLACKRGNIVYGALCALATVGIMFAMTSLSVKWFFLLFMFAPYGLFAYFIHQFNYFKLKRGIIRACLVVAFFNMTLLFVYLAGTRIVSVMVDIPIADWISRLGGYWAIALIGTVAFMPLDFTFSSMSLVVLKRIPMPGDRVKRVNRSDGSAAPGAEKPTYEQSADGKKYDIFGYEIHDDDGNGEKDPPEKGG